MNEEFTNLLGELRQAGERVNAQADALTLTASFFETSPLAFWIKTVGVDGSIKMLRINHTYERITGISAAEYEAQADSAFHSAEIAEQAYKSDLAAVMTGQPQPIDTVLRNRLTGAPVRLVGWKWRVPLHGVAVAICGFAQEFPVQ